MPSSNSIYTIGGSLLTNIASAIRSKAGVSSVYTPAQMADAIMDIPTGGFEITSYIGYGQYAGNTELISYVGDACFVESRAFNGCSNLLTASLSKCIIMQSEAFRNCSSLLTVNLPQCVTLMNSVFVGCNSLREVFLPNCLYIDDYAFSSCTEIEEIDIHNVFSFGGWGLQSTKIQSITLDNCYYIPYHCFDSCTNLSTASLPGCKTLENFAFAGATNLQEVYAPKCESVGQYVFSGCTNIQQLDLPNIKRIYGSAFYRCIKLSSLSIGQLVSSCSIYGSQTFAYCSVLLSIYVLCSEMCVLNDSRAFQNTPLASGSGHIYVPTSLYSNYYNDSAWSWYRSVLTSY